MSDILSEAAFTYRELSQYRYYFIFGDKQRNLYFIPLRLKEENFPHLIGMDKLTDKRSFIFEEGKSKVLQRILDEKITYKNVSDSPHLSECMDKLSFFSEFSDFFSEGMEKSLAFNFQKKLAYSTINASILIKHRNHNHLFLKYDSLHNRPAYFIPISFLNESSSKYTSKQKKLTLLYAERVLLSNETLPIEVLYKHKSFDKVVYDITII